MLQVRSLMHPDLGIRGRGANQVDGLAVRVRNTIQLPAMKRVKRVRDYEAFTVIELNSCSSTASLAVAGFA